jgi:hypothetical protein
MRRSLSPSHDVSMHLPIVEYKHASPAFFSARVCAYARACLRMRAFVCARVRDVVHSYRRVFSRARVRVYVCVHLLTRAHALWRCVGPLTARRGLAVFIARPVAAAACAFCAFGAIARLRARGRRCELGEPRDQRAVGCSMLPHDRDRRRRRHLRHRRPRQHRLRRRLGEHRRRCVTGLVRGVVRGTGWVLRGY